MHRSQVVNPRLEKQRNIDEMIEKNVNVERQRQIMGNLEQMMKKQKVLKSFILLDLRGVFLGSEKCECFK